MPKKFKVITASHAAGFDHLLEKAQEDGWEVLFATYQTTATETTVHHSVLVFKT